MPAQFPSSIPIATHSQTSDTLAAAQHTGLHNNLSAEVTAIATKLGIGSSVPAVNTVLHGGVSSSSWSPVDVSADVTGVLGTNHGGNGTTSTVGTGSAVFSNNPTLVAPTLTGGPDLEGGGVWNGGPTINQPTITDFTNSNHNHSNSAGGGAVLLPNNTALQAKNSGGTSVDTIKVGTDNNIRIAQVPYQDITTNSVKTDVLIQTGWNFVLMDVTEASVKTVTFPVAFDTLLSLVLTPLGETGAPADPTTIYQGGVTVPSDGVALNFGVRNLTQNSFDAVIKRSPASDTSRELFSWIAMGTKA